MTAADRSRAAIDYTVRALPLATIAAVLIATIVPTLWVVARGGSDFSRPLLVASFVGVLAAFSVDDAAGEFTAASVIPLWRRRAMRLALIAVPAGAVWATLLGIAALAADGGLSSWAVPTREIVTVAAVALGLAGVAHRQDDRSAAPAGALGAVLVVLVVSAFAFRWRWLPSLGMPDHHERWWVVAAAGAGIGVFTSRDPAARPALALLRHRSASG